MSLAGALAMTLTCHLLAPPVKAAESAEALFKKGQAEYAARNYKEAKVTLSKAAELASRNVPIQYYLGLAALGSGDTATLARAMARIIVMSPERSPNSKRAFDTLKRYSALVPYSAMGGSGGVSRFERKDMPVKIHVTQGKMLPEGHGYAMTFNNSAVKDELSKTCTNPQFFARLQTDPAYQSNMGQSVMQGINRWQFLAQENVLNFVFENDPTKADIVVFWLPAFDNSNVGPKAYTSFINSSNPAQRRVYMQFCTGAGIPKEIWNQWTTFSAAHEFGHAIGLNTHSTNTRDVMTDKLLWTRGANGYVMPGWSISENDKLTVRALYDVKPDIAR